MFNLLKKEKQGYSSCKIDLCGLFKGKTFQEIWEMNTRLSERGDVRVLKIRFANSDENISASGAFRVIALCNKKTETVSLLAVYPKTGKLGMASIPKSEMKRLIQTHVNALTLGNLIHHDVDNGLDTIEPPKVATQKT